MAPFLSCLILVQYVYMLNKPPVGGDPEFIKSLKVASNKEELGRFYRRWVPLGEVTAVCPSLLQEERNIKPIHVMFWIEKCKTYSWDVLDFLGN